ncbi:MAG: hypothetical protein AABY22_26500, partial [Nanoarchaeota archaeon]
EIENLDAAQVVDDLLAVWEGNYRDVTSRLDPDDEEQKIVVAGEMSWGDEPQGGGYQALKYADQTGVLKVFGIR